MMWAACQIWLVEMEMLSFLIPPAPVIYRPAVAGKGNYDNAMLVHAGTQEKGKEISECFLGAAQPSSNPQG